MRNKKFISIFIILLIIGCSKPQENNSRENKRPAEIWAVDTILTKQIILTIDGDPAIIKYHIQVADWNQPVLWSMQITSQDKSILSYESVDSSIDEFFHDTSYLFNCLNYIDCKKKWYLDRITNCSIDTIKLDDPRRGSLAHESNEYFDEFMKEFKIKFNNSKIAYDNYWAMYSKKEIISFVFYFSPEGRYTPSLVYSPKESSFIPIYSP